MGRGRSKKQATAGEEEGDGLEEVKEKEEALLFAVGEEVEVGSDDPGFVGSFYEGTVEAHLLCGDGGGYVVAYTTLEEGDQEGAGPSTAPLREEVRARNVRPRPPPVAGPLPEGLAMHDMVEAFHNEGWWSGVVTGLPLPLDVAPVDPRRRVYTVAFPTSREVMEFEEAALRPHRVFRHGSWVPAADVEDGGPAFREGSLVEVSRSAESFGKSWNPATVLKVIGSTNFLVLYRHIGDDGELATEIVDTQYIRPARKIIRMDSKYRFSPSSHVEVFHEGSWWPGIVLEASSSVFGKMYVVKLKCYTTGMDGVDGVDKLTVDNTKLRPQFDWDGRKWMRCMTKEKVSKAKKPVIRGSQLTSRKKPIPADLASCNDCDEIRDKPSSYLDKMLKTADVVPRPKETMKQQNAVLALASQITLPLQSSMTGSGHFKYESSLILGSPIELSSSQMDVMPSVPQTAGLQASLFGVFGQLRPIPQGPLLVMQSPNPDLSRIEGSEASTDEGCFLISNLANCFNFGSFAGIDMSRKRKECVSFQPPEELGVNPETMKKNRVDKTIEGTHNIAAISEEQTKLIFDDEHDELPTNVIAGSAIPSEKNTVSRIDPTPLEDNKGPQESSIVDIISLSGIDDIRQEENLILPATSTLNNSGDVNLLSSDSSTENQNKITKSEGCEISVEEDSSEEFCRTFLVMPDDTRIDQFPSAKSGEATRHDDLVCKENLGAIVECMTNIPTENLSILSPAMFDDLVLNQSSVSESCQDNNKDGMDEVDHVANVVGLASIFPETQHASVGCPFSATSLAALKGEIVLSHSSTWESALNEQSGVSQQDHISAMVESLESFAESSKSIDDSTITQLSSFDTSQYIDAELGNSLIVSNNIQDTPISKYVARTQNSSCPLMEKFLHVHENIKVDQPSESLAIAELPFMKTSPMWAQIEAMEVFSKVPQRPKFHQLQQYPPVFREGMALGLMFSFADFAESIKRLNVHHDDALFEDKMKCISLLEADGFDVKHLRSRLDTLLSLKNSWSKIQDMMKQSEKKIAQEQINDQQRRTEINMLSMVVHQLEQHAHIFRCIKHHAISEQMSRAVEKSRLKVEASQLKQSSLSTEQHFRSVVSAPW